MKLNTNRTLESYQRDLDLIKKAGYTPIACAQMMTYEVYVFNTKQEANLAYGTLELLDRKIYAWWYEKEEFLKVVEKYEADHGYKVQIFWL